MHKLLLRQLRKMNLMKDEIPSSIQEWNTFLERIEKVYQSFDEDRYLLERSLEISSKEMKERWEEVVSLLNQNNRSHELIKYQNLALNKLLLGESFSKILPLISDMVTKYISGGQMAIYVQEDNDFNLIYSTYGYDSRNTHEIDEFKKNKNEKKSLYHPIFCFQVNDTGDKQAIRSYPLHGSRGYLLGVLSVQSLTGSESESEEKEILSWAERLASVILEKKYVEAKLQDQQLQVMQSSRKAALGEMAGSIAHEINNPLTIIGGYSQKIERILKKENIVHESISDCVIKIKDTVMRISKTISSLKKFSRGDADIDINEHKLSDIISDALALSGERIRNSAIELEVNIHNADLQVYWDSIQIGQVLINLLNNSYDAIYETKNPWIKITSETNDDFVVIKISDSGKGIPEEVQQKMMEPFFTTKGVDKGTGIGLSLCQGLVMNHFGKLLYDKECDNTQFILKLPQDVRKKQFKESA